MSPTITKSKLAKYFNITGEALEEAKKNINPKKKTEAKEILEMASNYFSDAKHFESKKEIVNAFAALNYAHGWLDSGARLGIFNVTNNKLFTVR